MSRDFIAIRLNNVANKWVNACERLLKIVTNLSINLKVVVSSLHLLWNKQSWAPQFFIRFSLFFHLARKYLACIRVKKNKLRSCVCAIGVVDSNFEVIFLTDIGGCGSSRCAASSSAWPVVWGKAWFSVRLTAISVVLSFVSETGLYLLSEKFRTFDTFKHFFLLTTSWATETFDQQWIVAQCRIFHKLTLLSIQRGTLLLFWSRVNRGGTCVGWFV